MANACPGTHSDCSASATTSRLGSSNVVPSSSSSRIRTCLPVQDELLNPGDQPVDSDRDGRPMAFEPVTTVPGDQGNFAEVVLKLDEAVRRILEFLDLAKQDARCVEPAFVAERAPARAGVEIAKPDQRRRAAMNVGRIDRLVPEDHF